MGLISSPSSAFFECLQKLWIIIWELSLPFLPDSMAFQVFIRRFVSTLIPSTTNPFNSNKPKSQNSKQNAYVSQPREMGVFQVPKIRQRNHPSIWNQRFSTRVLRVFWGIRRDGVWSSVLVGCIIGCGRWGLILVWRGRRGRWWGIMRRWRGIVTECEEVRVEDSKHEMRKSGQRC